MSSCTVVGPAASGALSSGGASGGPPPSSFPPASGNGEQPPSHPVEMPPESDSLAAPASGDAASPASSGAASSKSPAPRDVDADVALHEAAPRARAARVTIRAPAVDDFMVTFPGPRPLPIRSPTARRTLAQPIEVRL